MYPISNDETEAVEQRTSSRKNSKSKKAKDVVQADDGTTNLFLYLSFHSIYAAKSLSMLFLSGSSGEVSKLSGAGRSSS